MIWEGILQFLTMFLNWIQTWAPGLPTPPVMFGDGADQIRDLMTHVNTFCAWVDFTYAKQAAVIVVSTWVTGFLLKLIRNFI